MALHWLPIATLLLVRRPRTVVAAVLFAVVAFGPVYLWTQRNETVAEYTRFSALPDIHMYRWIAASVEAVIDEEPFDVAQKRLTAELERSATEGGWTRVELYAHARQAGLSTIIDHPVASAMAYVRGLAIAFGLQFSKYIRLFDPDYSGQNLLGRLGAGQHVSGVNYLFILPAYAVLLALCVVPYVAAGCGVFALSWRRTVTITLLAATGYFGIMTGGAALGGADRMRVPLMPMVCVLAGTGLARWSRP